VSLGENLRAFRKLMERDGLRPTVARAAEVLRERVIQPWEIIFWLPAAEVARIEPPADARFRVVRSLEELEEGARRDLAVRLGESTVSVWEARLRQGCELHLLFLGERLAASRFVVWGSVTPFQNVVLTPRDTMGLDVRVDPELRGRGLAPLFFSISIQDLAQRGCERVFATVAVHNVRSLKTLERVGFRPLLRCRVERGRFRYDRTLIR
jgi:RimJ/RimL family protein N-acetyltransferase